MRPRPADRRERRTPGPATEPRQEPDGAAADTAVMDSVWESGGMHVHVLGRGERFWLWLTKAISVMSSLPVKRKSFSRYAQNGSITHGEIRRCDETNGGVRERAHRDSRTAEGVSQVKFCNVLHVCESSAPDSDLSGDTLQMLTRYLAIDYCCGLWYRRSC